MIKKKIHNKSTEVYDVVRIMATFLVVIGHATYSAWSSDSGEILLVTDNASRVYNFLCSFIGKIGGWAYGFHMPLFFMLSGALYGYSKHTNSFNELIKSKIHRLIIPFYLVGILYMFPIKFLAGFYSRDNFFVALQGFLLGGNLGHLWFLLSLFWVFVLFYPLEKYVLKKFSLIGLIIACLLLNWFNMGLFDYPIITSTSNIK